MQQNASWQTRFFLCNHMVFGMISITKECLHLPSMRPLFVGHFSHHDDVIALRHFEGFLHKDTVDDTNASEANDDLVQNGEDVEVRTDRFL